MTTAFFDRHIHSIPDGIMKDIDLLLVYVEAQNKQDEDPRVADTAARLEKYLATFRKSNADEEEKDSIVSSLTSVQEDKLKEAHAKDYHGTDDDMPDAYERWLADLDLNELKKILV